MTARRTALVTKSATEDAELFAALDARGFAPLAEPLLDIRLVTGATLPLTDIQGYLCTSANGVRALAANGAPRALPLWAVGERTARVARDSGFSDVTAGSGGVAALAALVARRVDPAGGPLLYASAAEIAGDPAALLAASGHRLRRVVLYRAVAAERFSPALDAALAAGTIACALFFSPRGGQCFATLAQAAGRGTACGGIRAFALSRAVADTVAGLGWKSLDHAAEPRREALLRVLDAAPWEDR